MKVKGTDTLGRNGDLGMMCVLKVIMLYDNMLGKCISASDRLGHV